MAKTENLQAKVTVKLKERVEKVAEFEGVNKSDIVTMALLEFLPKIEDRMN